ncbi:MAG: sigma-54-dependent transcriptional regulator [Candidatus Methylomirabilales bacterium]
MKPHILLVVNDEKDFPGFIQGSLIADRYEVSTARSGEEALQRVRETSLDLVLADLVMPGMGGLELLERINDLNPELAVVMITGVATVETAIEAMRRGAYDYLTKPFEWDELAMRVDRALEHVRLLDERRYLHPERVTREGLEQLVGQSPAMEKIRDLIKQVAPTSAPVLITGESGTGKELVARALHLLSPRRERRFVAINCTALPDSLLESELFGHAKGSFTGAIKDKRGLVEEANGGSLFLDEIGDVSPAFQGKLLRVLQEGEYMVLGSTKVKLVDLRVIAASSRDLRAKVKQGEFREDLFYRLNVIPIALSPLREQRQDIPLLTDHFLRKYAPRLGRHVSAVSAEAVEWLVQYDWPGNVRELEHVIERGLILCHKGILTLEELVPPELSQGDTQISDLALPFREARQRALDTFIKKFVAAALLRTQGNVTRAAQESHLERQSFQRLMKQAGIQSREYRSPDKH